MKELVEENYNYFQWDGIVKGRNDEKNDTIKNCFDLGMSSKRIALVVKLSEKEVILRMKEMRLARPSRMRKAVVLSN